MSLMQPRNRSSNTSSSGGGGSFDRVTDTGMRVRTRGGDTPQTTTAPESSPTPSEGGAQPRPSSFQDPNNHISMQLEAAAREARRIQGEVMKLKERDNASSPESDIVASSREARNEEDQLRGQINRLEATDPGTERLAQANQNYMDILDNQFKQLQEREARRVESIERDFAAQIDQTEDAQGRQAAQQRSSLIRSGGYLGESASAIGVLNNLAQTHRQEISALNAQKHTAITEAKEAFADKQTQVAMAQAQQAIEFENQIKQRENEFFRQSLAVIQEKRQQESAQLQNESRKLQNSMARAESIAPAILDKIDMIQDPALQNEVLQGYSEKHGIDMEMLRGSLERHRAEAYANELDNQATRALIGQRDRSNRPKASDKDDEIEKFVNPETGEEYDLTTVAGIQSALFIGEDRSEIRAWLDENTSYTQGTINDLLDNTLTPGDLKMLTANHVENTFNKSIFRRRDGEPTALQPRKSELQLAKERAKENINKDDLLNKQQRDFAIDLLDDIDLDDISI